MAVVYCLDCGGRIYLGHRPWVGQAALCDDCGADLEVIRINPLELDWTDNLIDEEGEETELLDRESVPT